ncbi:uncharacterized protein LOC143194295 [Rhynchophorus ferrugineus]|uniref:uncharacterized protein LOC143194295 n=1 Tax=Rhynchophorus ferrugineus TaxID=354439 RepID=UPI003FCD15C9
MANEKKVWSNDKLFLLIDLYRERPRLWNPKHSEYKLKTKRNDDWAEIAKILDDNVTDIKKKMESLLTSFRRERQRCEDSNRSGSGTGEIYKSKWFAFAKMMFLRDKFTPHVTDDTMDSSTEEMMIKTEVNSNTETLKTAPPDVTKPSTSKTFKSRKRAKLVKQNLATQRSNEAYNILQETLKRRDQKDNSSTFGEYVANKHRCYSSYTKSIVEHLITNILFEADMGMYEKSGSNCQHFTAPTHSEFLRSASKSPTFSSTPSPVQQRISSRTPTPTCDQIHNNQQIDYCSEEPIHAPSGSHNTVSTQKL